GGRCGSCVQLDDDDAVASVGAWHRLPQAESSARAAATAPRRGPGSFGGAGEAPVSQPRLAPAAGGALGGGEPDSAPAGAAAGDVVAGPGERPGDALRGAERRPARHVGGASVAADRAAEAPEAG